MRKIKHISSEISNNILAIDAGGSRIGAGINGWIVYFEHTNNHTDQLLESIDYLLKKAGVKVQEVAGVSLMIGPGSFTGLRVGATIANGIGYANKVGVGGFSEFDLVTKLYSKTDLTIFDGKRGELFVKSAQAQPSVLSVDKLEPLVTKGDRVYIDTPELVGLLHPKLKKAGTILIGPMRFEDRLVSLMNCKVPKSYRQILPLYLREANITLSKKSTVRAKT